MTRKSNILLFVIPLVTALSLLATGCDDRDYDHDPPEGKGTLYVDNNTSDGMDVYIDGARVEGVGRRRKRYYDLDPGVYRIALSGDNSDRSYAGDVDVLLGRRTIMDVTIDIGNYRRFDVFVFFD